MPIHAIDFDPDRELSRLGLAAHGLDDDAKLAAARALDNFEREVARAAKVSKDFRQEARAEKQWGVLRDARAKLDRDLANMRRPAADAFTEADTALEALRQGDKPATEIGKLMQHLQRAELRTELRGLDKDGRRSALLEAAKAGNGEPLRAAREALVPLLRPEILELVENEYLMAAGPDVVRAYQAAMAGLQRAETFSQSAQRTADRIIKREKDILPAPKPMRPTWDAATKSAFIAEHGEDAFLRLTSGTGRDAA